MVSQSCRDSSRCHWSRRRIRRRGQFAQTSPRKYRSLGSSGLLSACAGAVTIPSMQNTWLYYALGSAIFAAAINVLAKFGMKYVDKDLATAVRRLVQAIVVVGSGGMVVWMKSISQLHWRRC